jgi:very-short-patch-repair endonuclease
MSVIIEGQVASEPEVAVYYALRRVPVAFVFQSSQMGGRMQRGGTILDFFIRDLMLGIEVMGLYWHTPTVAQDRLLRAALEGNGIRVVWIDDDDALRAPDWYVQEALQFRDHSKLS